MARALSSPLPVPGQVVWGARPLISGGEEVPLSKDVLIKHFLKQKLQANLLQKAGAKNHMEDVSEEVETKVQVWWYEHQF